MVGVNEHLHVLILTQVEDSITIDGLRLTCRQVLYHHIEGLLVGLCKLGLRRVGNTRDTWWQHVVDRLLVIVLLNVHSADL